MLQFVTQPDTNYSILEQCQMVIEGGCQWIQLHLPDHDDSALRELATLLIPLCKESNVFLTIEDRPELARELGLHGVHLSLSAGRDARTLREEFGPEAIIGVEVAKPEDVIKLTGVDIDYVTASTTLPEECLKEIVDAAMLDSGIVPVVFSGNFTVDNVADCLRQGASGVCTGLNIVEAENPVEYTRLLIYKLKDFSGSDK